MDAEKRDWPGLDEPALASRLGRGEAGILSAGRRRAFECFRALPLPGHRMEEWRRTDADAFPFARMNPPSALSVIERAETAPDDAAFDAVVTVDERGISIRANDGGPADRGVAVTTLERAVEQRPAVFGALLAASEYNGGMAKFEALNHAFWNMGLAVHVPANVAVEKGILIRYNLRAAGQVFIPRLVVVLEERSRATIVEDMVSDDAGALIAVMNRLAFVGRAAQLKWIALQEWGRGTYYLSSDHTRIEGEGRLDWLTVNLGGKLSKMNLAGEVAGPGAAAELDGLYFANEGQHMDQKTLQIHSAPNTFSNLLYKGAVRDEAYSVYQGLIIAKPGSSKVDAYQKNNNLVLNDGARADSLPGLQIDTDDLKCSHGSTIGNLDAEEVFYLRARGLDETEARRMLIKGFFEELIDRIPYEHLREHVRKRVEDKMKRTE